MRARTLLSLAAVGAGGVWLARRLSPPAYSFAGKVVIVTGGSRGLGLELSRRLADAGAALALCARDPAELDAARLELERRGARVFTGPCDVGDRMQVRGFVDAVLGRFGRIDVLINNAGVIAVGPYETMTEDDFVTSIRVHLDGPRYFCEAVVPVMRTQGGGRIVNVASIGGRVNLPHALPYCAGKFALVGYSEGLGVEVAKDGIRVTTVCPGVIRTGSPINVEYKGQAEKEYGWFATSDVIPVLSISSGAAADRILDACARGRREVIFPFPAKAAAVGHDLFRETSLRALELVNRMMPAPGGVGPDGLRGYELDGDAIPGPAYERNVAAAARNNE